LECYIEFVDLREEKMVDNDPNNNWIDNIEEPKIDENEKFEFLL